MTQINALWVLIAKNILLTKILRKQKSFERERENENNSLTVTELPD